MSNRFAETLESLQGTGNLRTLPDICHQGRYIISGEKKMLNLSSNDYLGINSDSGLKEEFLETNDIRNLDFSSSSSRSLTGNYKVYSDLESTLCKLSGKEASLILSSGYCMNSGILPALTESNDLILADKLVHASIIDGLRLSKARTLRFRHGDYEMLERLAGENHGKYDKIFIVVESIYSMDGDTADLPRLAALKKSYPNIYLYVDEAHAIGVRGCTGMGMAEEHGCIRDIDFLCGTFGKAIGSVGAYILCSKPIREYLVNKMRPFIFTTALPPVNIRWTDFIMNRLPGMQARRQHLKDISSTMIEAIKTGGMDCPSESHIIPYLTGDSMQTTIKAKEMQDAGFYLLPIRPPTVPEGTSRLRISLTAGIGNEEVEALAACLFSGKGKIKNDYR